MNRRLLFVRASAFLATAIFCIGIAAEAVAQAAGDWKTKWDTVVAAAEKEGKLAVSGPSGSLWRTQLAEFQKAYPKIALNITPAASRDFWPRLIKEREVGQNLWDLRIGGSDTQVFDLIEQNALANVREMFILPEVTDESVWHGGFAHMFMDNAGKYAVSFAAYSSPLAFYNPKFVKPGDLPDFKALLDPKWKGKIAMADPRGGSTAVSMAIVLKKFGEPFIRDLLVKQEPVIVENPRQIMNWFVSGKYPVAMGIPNSAIQDFQSKGVAFEMGEVSGLDIWSVGVGGIQVMEPRPNPNATIVFVNWLLTRDVQARIMEAVKLNSRRKDVPLGDTDRALDWGRYKDFVSGQHQDHHKAMSDFKTLAREILR